MIARYSRPEMARVWTEESKIGKWLDVELAALEALARDRQIPQGVPARVKRKAAVNIKRMQAIEGKVKHDVIAFLTSVAERVGPDAKFIHFGLTSSDILDTALALQVKDASAILITDLKALLQSLKKKARQHKYTLMVGRSHGVHAEPTTFGLKLAVFYAEFKRNLERFERAAENMRYGKISGAVGTFANVTPHVEALICKKLGLRPAPISTQILQRDRHAEYLTTMAIIGSSLEKLATELRNLQRTEILEVQEFFSEGQKGSSAMPHKRNPITVERIAGLSRVLRGNALAALENITLWHERDITHSSVERIIFPDSTILLDYMLVSMREIIAQLVVQKANMLANLEKTQGLIFSQGLLLYLIRKGMAREAAYAIVQQCSKETWDHHIPFKEAVQHNRQIKHYLTSTEVNRLFDYRYHTKHVNTIFQRVGV